MKYQLLQDVTIRKHDKVIKIQAGTKLDLVNKNPLQAIFRLNGDENTDFPIALDDFYKILRFNSELLKPGRDLDILIHTKFRKHKIVKRENEYYWYDPTRKHEPHYEEKLNPVPYYSTHIADFEDLKHSLEKSMPQLLDKFYVIYSGYDMRRQFPIGQKIDSGQINPYEACIALLKADGYEFNNDIEKAEGDWY